MTAGACTRMPRPQHPGASPRFAPRSSDACAGALTDHWATWSGVGRTAVARAVSAPSLSERTRRSRIVVGVVQPEEPLLAVSPSGRLTVKRALAQQRLLLWGLPSLL